MKIATLAPLLLTLAGCGGSTGDAPTARPTSTTHRLPPVAAPFAPPPGSVSKAEPSDAPRTPEEIERMNEGCRHRESTNVVSKCEVQPKRVGAWKPTKADIAAAVNVGGGVCNCAEPVDRAILTCMDSAKAALTTVTIGKDDDPMDCTVAVSSAEIDGHRWVRFHAANRDLATFFSIDTIVELGRDGAVLYVDGFDTLDDATVMSGGQGVTKKLREDWPKLSPAAKQWLGGS